MAERTYEEYVADFKARLDNLQRRAWSGAGSDIGLLAEIQLLSLDLLKTTFLVPPSIFERPPYTVKTFGLDTAFTEASPLEVNIGGSYLAAYTDGMISDLSLRLSRRTADSLPLSQFNNISYPFDKFYLYSTAQTGKTITFFIGQKGVSAGTTGVGKWAGGGKPPAVYPVLDMGESAVRLGAIPSGNRSGVVMFQDGFEDVYDDGTGLGFASGAGLAKWNNRDTSGTGASIGLDDAYALSGAFSCKLVTGNAEGDDAFIGTTLPSVPKGRLGYEIAFTAPNAANADEIEIFLVHLDGTVGAYAYVRFIAGNDALQVLVQDGTWASVQLQRPPRNETGVFSVVKVIADFAQAKFILARLNDIEYDLSAYRLRMLPFSYNGRVLGFRITARSKVAGTNYTRHVDNVILTQNEP